MLFLNSALEPDFTGSIAIVARAIPLDRLANSDNLRDIEEFATIMEDQAS